MLFAISVALAAPLPAAAPTATPAPAVPELQTLDEVRSLADAFLDDPELAAVLLLNPGWQGAVSAPHRVENEDDVRAALAEQQRGLAPPVSPDEVRVFVARGENVNPSATAHGGTVLVLLRETPPVGPAEIARLAAPALLTAESMPAAPDERVSEPLLAFGEAVVRAGELALMALPPALRPVHDWLEPKEATPALETLASVAFDRDIPWPSRQVRLARIRRPGGASPELANAAALVLEAYGNVAAARENPVDLLMTWWTSKSKDYPSVPGSVRRALARPIQAGVSDKDDPEAEKDRKAIARSALERVLARGGLPEALPEGTDRGLQELAAANARNLGGDPCLWLRAPLPEKVRTGCRDEGEAGGWLYTRPRVGAGFEIYARSAAGEEMLILRRPTWVLFPAYLPSTGDIVFAGPEGLWRVALAGGGPPRKFVDGAFRHLGVFEDTLAAVSWPEGQVTMIVGDEATALDVNGRGGLAWLERDLLVASDGEALHILSRRGDATAWEGSYRCSRSLAVGGPTLLGAVAAPCEPGLVRISLIDTSVSPLLSLPSSPLGLLLLPDGTLVFGMADGLYQWGGGESANRIGVGLTPGPA